MTENSKSMCNKWIETLTSSTKLPRDNEFVFGSGMLSSQFLYLERGLQKKYKTIQGIEHLSFQSKSLTLLYSDLRSWGLEDPHIEVGLEFNKPNPSS